METRTKYILIVLLSAVIVAFESIAVEALINIEGIDPLLVSSIPLMSGGMILMAISPRALKSFTRQLGRRGWGAMGVMCALSAIGVFLWFDAVHRIGASKEAILGGGSSEVLFIVLLSALFLKERLNRWEVLGSILVLLGVFVVLSNRESVSLHIGLGEAEAILSSFLLAASVMITTFLLWTHDLTALSSVQLVLSGAMLLFGSLALGLTALPEGRGVLLMLLLGVAPGIGLWTYNAGLPKIGASLTSVLFALCGIFTVGAQFTITLIFPEAEMILPENLSLVVLGGVIAFLGVYVLEVEGGRSRRDGVGATKNGCSDDS